MDPEAAGHDSKKGQQVPSFFDMEFPDHRQKQRELNDNQHELAQRQRLPALAGL